MSDPRSDFFASGAGSAKKAPDRSDFFSGDFDVDTLPDKQEAPRGKPSLAMAPVGGAEMLLRGATGVVAAVPASVAYAGAAAGKAMGLDVDPSKTMADVQEYLTYDPVSDSGKAGDELFAQGAGKVLAPVVRKLDEGATAVGRVSPTAEAYLREAPGAAEAAAGLIGLSPLATPAMQALKAAPSALTAGARNAAAGTAAAGRRIAAAGESVSDAAVRAAGGTVRPPVMAESAPNPFSQQSMGAAAAVPKLSQVSPELRQALREAAKQTGGAVEPEVFARHLEADSLPIRMQLTEGQATRDPDVFSKEMNERGKHPEFAARFNEQKQQLVDNLDEMRRESSPSVVGNDHVQNGQQLLDEIKTKDNTEKADIGAAYDEAKALNGGDLPMDGQGFAASADAALKGNMKARYLPADVAGDLAEIRESGAMDFTQFENMRTTLAAAARKAEAARDGNAARAISLVRNALESTEPVGVAKEVKAKFDVARSKAKARFDRIRDNPAIKAAVDDDVPVGEASPLADTFAEKYIVKGSKAHLERLQENLKDSDTAKELMAAAGLNYLKSKSGIDMFTNRGEFSQAGYNRALAQLRPKLEALVGEKGAEQAEALGNVARNIMQAPSGAHVNYSNSTVAAMKEGAKSAIEGAVNVKSGGIPVGTWTRQALGNRAEKRAVREALKPGAGLGRIDKNAGKAKP
jgi:hypothetical protein